MEKTLKVSEIIYREDLYPRIEADVITIQRYAENLEVLPPIEVNQNNILIDGFHRLTAHKKAEAEEIKVIITETETENQLFALAIQRNSNHGLQMNEQDKKKVAIRLYEAGGGLSKEIIAKTLSVSTRMINNYLTDIDKTLREERKQKIFDMYMSCSTQEEIAEAIGFHKDTVSEEVSRISETFLNSDKVAKEFLDEDFDIPIYNIWTFAKKTNKTNHFGNSEQRILENLLYLYTEPFDIVLDPFAGGGSTIDICKKRLRRYYVSDLNPIIEREKEIRKLDICKELPTLNKRWSDITLTYLDPPYWKQAEGQYSKDAEDLANMSLEDFSKNIISVVNKIADKQSKGIIALLIQPTQWKSENKNYTDHVTDLVKNINQKKLILENRVSCPYSTQQYNPQQVEWAKTNKKLLVLTRELIIWRIK